jgi:hypothetical protein
MKKVSSQVRGTQVEDLASRARDRVSRHLPCQPQYYVIGDLATRFSAVCAPRNTRTDPSEQYQSS